MKLRITIDLSAISAETDVHNFHHDVYVVGRQYDCKVTTDYGCADYAARTSIFGDARDVWKVINTLDTQAKSLIDCADLSAATRLVFKDGFEFKGRKW